MQLLQPGVVPYDVAFRMQKGLQSRVISGETEEALIVLEHPPAVTIGKSGSEDNILVALDKLEDEGVSLFFTDRGGDVTCHGPGQIVAYPIMDLGKRGRDAREYVHKLEEVLLRTLRDFSIEGSRDPGHAGIWVDNNEIAAIGIGLRRWVTIHGLALNVDTSPRLFSMVNPCGFTDRQAVSMAQLLKQHKDIDKVRESFLNHFSAVFEVEFTPFKGDAYADQAPILV